MAEKLEKPLPYTGLNYLRALSAFELYDIVRQKRITLGRILRSDNYRTTQNKVADKQV